MTTRQEAPPEPVAQEPVQPVTQEQVQELPRDVSPYLQALVLAYLLSGGEESEQTKLRTRLFRTALASAAVGAFVFRDRDQGAAAEIDFTETAEPFTAAVKESVNDYLARGDERDSKTDSKFAESVASTLSTGAANRLTLEVLNQLDPDGTAYKKLWLTRADDKVRLSHRELHGRTASVGEPFKKGLHYPGDPTAPLDERINCRCFLFAVPSDKDTETANAFEPADLTTAFAASAALHTLTAGNMMRRLMHLAPWTWQPRDSWGRWVEVGDILDAPSSSGKGREGGRVTEIIGRNRVRLESLRSPGQTWDVDSRDTSPGFGKGRIPSISKPAYQALPQTDRPSPTLPHLQPISNPRAERGRRSERLPPEFGEITPEIPHRPVERVVRPPIYGLDRQKAGAPIFESDELAPGKIVVVESKTKPGTFRHMVVDEIGEDGNTVLLLYPPEPRRKSAEAKWGGTEYERVFQLQSPAARQEVFLDEGVLYEPADSSLVAEVEKRMQLSSEGFANPYWFRETQDAFKYGPSRTDWVPERKARHDQFIQAEFDQAGEVEEPIFYLIGGGTSSGKSTVVEGGLVPIPPRNMRVEINADDAKYVAPEFVGLIEAGHRGAASFVHEESSDIAGRMVREAPPNKHVLLDGIANKGRGAVLERLKTARAQNKKVIAHYTTLPTEMAIRLSDARGDAEGPKGGRYVPHDLIRQSHEGVVDTFFDLAKHGDIEELYLWNTEIFMEPRLIFSQVNGVSTIVDEALLTEFLQKSKTRRHTYESIVALTESGFAFPPHDQIPGLHEAPGLPINVPVGAPGGEAVAMSAAGEYSSDLDWDTKIQVAIEVAAEMTGSQDTSSDLPVGDPAIEAYREQLRAEFAAMGDSVWWLPYDSE